MREFKRLPEDENKILIETIVSNYALPQILLEISLG